MDHQIAKRSSEARRVIDFTQLLTIGVSHRRTQVHHEIPGDVRFRLEFLYVIFIGLRIDQPVDVLWVIARRVFAMLTKLHGKTLKRARVKSLQKSPNNELSSQVQSFNLVYDFRFEILLGSGHQQTT